MCFYQINFFVCHCLFVHLLSFQRLPWVGICIIPNPRSIPCTRYVQAPEKPALRTMQQTPTGCCRWRSVTSECQWGGDVLHKQQHHHQQHTSYLTPPPPHQQKKILTGSPWSVTDLTWHKCPQSTTCPLFLIHFHQ